MSALTEQVAREHRAQEVLSRLSDREGKHLYVGCTCGVGPLSALSHAAHVATVAEQAVRANDARAAFESIDVDELARVITDAGDRSPDYIACVIYDYLTGDESDE